MIFYFYRHFKPLGCRSRPLGFVLVVNGLQVPCGMHMLLRLGPSWPLIGATFGHLGATWRPHGVILGQLQANSGSPRSSLEPFEVNLMASWPHLAPSWATLLPCGFNFLQIWPSLASSLNQVGSILHNFRVPSLPRYKIEFENLFVQHISSKS